MSSTNWRPSCSGLDVLTLSVSPCKLIQSIILTCTCRPMVVNIWVHDDVIKWKHFPCYWPFVRGIHRSPVNSPHKGQWRGALMFFSICTWIHGWVNKGEAGDLKRHRTHYDVTVMWLFLDHLTENIRAHEVSHKFSWWCQSMDTLSALLIVCKGNPRGAHRTVRCSLM